MKKALAVLVVVFFCPYLSGTVLAAELVEPTSTTAKARVLEIIRQEVVDIPGTDTKTTLQALRVRIIDGEEAGKEIVVEDDHLGLEEGEVFYLRHVEDPLDGTDYYSVTEPYRLPTLFFFGALFILLVLVFGGRRGMRGLGALALSFFFIFYLLFPGILKGYSPILISVFVASLIVVLGSYITHGFNKTTTSAVLGMIVSIIVTGLLAYAAVYTGRFTGMSSDETMYLNFDTRGAIDFTGLLLGGILIGLLGVLDDAAIAQAIAIEELARVGPHLPRSFIVKRALRIGREHIGALVNTLAVAYVGASLPLLLLFSSYLSTTNLAMTINREIVASEIIRTLIGSIGIVLAVPITTLISSYILVKKRGEEDPELLAREKAALEDLSHHA